MRRIEVPDYVRGLIFDCDGTLVDSMPLHMKAWEYVITAQGGIWDLDFFHAKKGMPEAKIVSLYNAQFASAFDPVKTVETKHEYFRTHALEFKPIPHVLDVVRRYQSILPMAVVSGGVREIVELELTELRIKNCFDVILTADDGIKPKPAPDIFLEAARRLGIDPEHCQVFEDGDLGLEGARLAGMLATDIR
ncbi:MAG: HAD family phosphatase [Acidobacteria bacterium]|nr:HAD family phosphatase [Acidobacteriota bacterium]